MNDIKLTDEATIDSLKEMAIKFSKDTYVNRVLVNAINLIHRLQSENKELRTESDKMVSEHLAFVELAKKADEQQKAEIAELKAQCSKSSYRDSWKNKFFKAQEEIERLKDEKEEIKLFNLAIQNGEVDMRIESEMAKSFYGSIVQVFEQNGAKNFFTTTIDIEGKKGRYAFTIEKVGGQTVAEKLAEQKAEIERLTKELEKVHEIERANIRAEIADAGTSCHWCERQSVKDTAKEIYDWLQEHIAPTPNGLCIFKTYIKERYGVEVE